MSLQWREQLSVGNDLIDSDHKYLIEIINQAESSLKTHTQSGLQEALDRLSKYSKVHFAREEKIARAVGYGPIEQLHESHEALIQTLDQVKRDVDGQQWSTASAERFAALLRNWLVDHVIKEDMLMKPMIKKFSPSLEPS